ncbi:MAG: M81 family metallopeptidase [Coxiellaceae bacterium]|nr:M81 family metallopeptidase [Coxiellaceae bacterium]
MANILVAGFMHETNTFCTQATTLNDFEQADAYPGLTFDKACLEVFRDNNIGLSGFIEQAQRLGHTVTPLLWCQAPPFGIVTEEAYEYICNLICEGVAKHQDYDAIFLDLHGAMVSEVTQDGEGELAKRIRAVCGDDIPIACALDLHANVTQEMYELFDVMEIYRTYPHIDIFDTGVRAATVLDDRLELGKPFYKNFYKLPFLIPLTSQCSLIEPGKGIYNYLGELAKKHDCYLSYAMGFPLADIFDCGPAIVAYGENKKQVDKACKTLLSFINSHKHEFKLDVYPADEAVAKAIEKAKVSELPVIVNDTQDNPGGGGSSDTMGLLAALVKAHAEDAVLALVHDAEVAEHAHAIGLNNEMVIDLGGRSGIVGDVPYHGKFIVKALADGKFTGTGAYYHNVPFDLGPMAVLEVEGVKVIVSAKKIQAADQAIFRHVGIEPSDRNILALKSSVHFRADFTDIASDIITAIAPGACVANLRELPYEYLRSDLQIL